MKYVCCFIMLFCATVLKAQQNDSIPDIRDAIGDLNANSIKKGGFPGAIQLPGKSNISIGFGGFIRTVVYHDSHKEQKGEIILPAYLNPADKAGQFGISSRLSRFLFDARAPTEKGNIRGYFEVDFTNGGFNIRHAYGSWANGKNEIMIGQYWSAFMDLGALAYIEGTGEPAISGAIFIRQGQIRYTRKVSTKFKWYASIEDPSSNDGIQTNGFTRFTAAPDFVAGFGISDPKIGHFQLGGVLRYLSVDSADYYKSNGTALGISFGSHLNTGSKGKLVLSGAYGKGLGRYLLGINGAAGYLDNNKQLQLANGYGAVISYQQQLTDMLRCNVGFGTAGIEDKNKSNITFKNSVYTNANLFIKITPFFTAGIEYIYGENNFTTGVKGMNHRVQIGVQVF
jgi:DcaP outer membrane protein